MGCADDELEGLASINLGQLLPIYGGLKATNNMVHQSIGKGVVVYAVFEVRGGATVVTENIIKLDALKVLYQTEMKVHYCGRNMLIFQNFEVQVEVFSGLDPKLLADFIASKALGLTVPFEVLDEVCVKLVEIGQVPDKLDRCFKEQGSQGEVFFQNFV
jgi:hypothetical protein